MSQTFEKKSAVTFGWECFDTGTGRLKVEIAETEERRKKKEMNRENLVYLNKNHFFEQGFRKESVVTSDWAGF